MIFDLVRNYAFYLKHPIFEQVFAELYKYDHFADGKLWVQINEDIFIKRVVYNTVNFDWITESHRKYVDVQIIITGEELIKVYTADDLVAKNEYDSSDDVILYDTEHALNKLSSTLYLRPGYMAIFMPQDAHMTQIAVGNDSQYIKKIVIKVPQKYFQ